MKGAALIYNPHLPKAVSLARQLARVLGEKGWTAWVMSAWDEKSLRDRIDAVRVAVTLGGDGTVLRAARVAGPAGVPLVGVNLGRLGFLTELTADSVEESLPGLLDEPGWVEARAMLVAELLQPVKALPAETEPGQLKVDDCEVSDFVALNDIAVGRGERWRSVRLHVTVDSSYLTTYRADGVVISTATGSTAYSLAAGGPILHPEMRHMLLTPLAVHLKLSPPLVLPEDSVVQVQIFTDHSASLSVDGQIDVHLRNGATIRARLSSHKALFLRNQRPSYFYETLAERLRW